MNSYAKCKNCGADYGLHHYETNQCPVGGVEAPVGRPQVWMTVTFEEAPSPGPTPESFLAMKAERDSLLALLSDIDELLAEWKSLDYINYGKMKSTFDTDLERVELRIEEAIAAAKGEG